jgi:hypothetical protein
MTLLQSTLELLRDRLDAAFQGANPRSEEWVTLTNAVDLDGRVFESARNKIVMMLVGLQTDPAMRTLPARPTGVPPLNVNALVLFVANFTDSNYPTGLGMLSRAIGFFHQNPVFTHDRLPGTAPEIDRIAMDFVSLSLPETNDLMGMLGLRYMPCALYTLRTLPFVSDAGVKE